MIKYSLIILCLVGWITVAGAEELPRFSISLVQAESQAQTTSARIASKQSELKSAEAASAGQYSLLWPKLSLEGSYTYLSSVPDLQVNLVPNRTLDVALGNHNNYSIGLQAAWNVWDSFMVSNNWKAMQSLEQARQQEFQLLQREVTLKTRLAYFQTQLAAEKLALTYRAIQLAQQQYHDIQAQTKAGTSSRMDMISSHLEVLSQMRLVQSAQADLAVAMRDLAQLVGQENQVDVSAPWYTSEFKELMAGLKKPTVQVALDPLDQSVERFKKHAQARLDPEHPQAMLFIHMAESAQSSAESLASGHWPKLQIVAKTSLDYPNGPIAEQINQNTLAVKASWSIWEANRVVNQTEEKTQQAKAQEQLAENAKKELLLSWQKAQDRLQELEAEEPVIETMVAETKELARVSYTAYQAGRAVYLEVQAANLKVLEAGTQAALNKAQRLIQQAMLESLSSDKE